MPVAFDGTQVPETLQKLACGGTPRWDEGSGYAYRCDDCMAVIGSIGQSDRCKVINKASEYQAPPGVEFNPVCNVSYLGTDRILVMMEPNSTVAVNQRALAKSVSIKDTGGKEWECVASAFNAFKTGEPDRDEGIMAKMAATLFAQHPLLAEHVSQKGGCEFLRTCSYIHLLDDEVWQGIGINSRLIRALVRGFQQFSENGIR
jgi:hypothetical protein